MKKESDWVGWVVFGYAFALMFVVGQDYAPKELFLCALIPSLIVSTAIILATAYIKKWLGNWSLLIPVIFIGFLHDLLNGK